LAKAKKARAIPARRLFTFSEVAGDRDIVSVSVGPRLDPVLLSSEPDPASGRPSGSPRKKARGPLGYRIHHQVAEDVWRTADLPWIDEDAHFALQPFGDDGWLLVRCRASGESDRNACVCDASGRPVRAFHAGDGIQDVQATEDGSIWISYFDEGVFGDTPLGACGLVCLDGQGRLLFDFRDLGIADCYALNVPSPREVWLCYYTGFPLVKLLDGAVSAVWPNFPVPGASGFAIDGDIALFSGGYRDKGVLTSIELDGMKTSRIVPLDADARPLGYLSAFGRGPRLFLRAEEGLYAMDVADSLA
jgi:hypothetical protein